MKPSSRLLAVALALAGADKAVGSEARPPIVDSVAYTGNSEVTDADIVAAIAIKPGAALTGPAMVKADIDRIVALYRAKGFDLAISPDIGHPAPGHLSLRYLINEKGHGGDAGAALPPGGPAPEHRQ